MFCRASEGELKVGKEVHAAACQRMKCGHQEHGHHLLSCPTPALQADIRSRVILSNTCLSSEMNWRRHFLTGPRYRAWVHVSWLSVIHKLHLPAQPVCHSLISSLINIKSVKEITLDGVVGLIQSSERPWKQTLSFRREKKFYLKTTTLTPAWVPRLWGPWTCQTSQSENNSLKYLISCWFWSSE